jgi:hypothetical protein
MNNIAIKHLFWLLATWILLMVTYAFVFTWVVDFLSALETGIVLLLLSVTWIAGGMLVFFLLWKGFEPARFTKGLLAMTVVQFLLLLLSFILIIFIIKENKALLCYHVCIGFIPMLIVQTIHLARLANEKTHP